jgi:imidazolonepropionase-like amidohydrolase
MNNRLSPPWQPELAVGQLSCIWLPDGKPRHLWLDAAGHYADSGPADAPLLAPAGGFACHGLIDSHAHLSWPHQPDSPAHTPAFMNQIRRMYAEMGVTSLRDMGSHRDEVCQLPPEAGLPLAQTSGKMLLRDNTWPLTDTTPENLLREAHLRLDAGAKWIKVFADFSSDFQGRENPGFSGDDVTTYSLELMQALVQQVHARGGRVASHCYTTAGTQISIDAGVDSLEHGWAVDRPMLQQMVERDIAWVPLIGIAGQMREIAIQHGELDKVVWIDDRMTALQALLPVAAQLGVQVLAGTDWFPNPTVVDEVLELHAFGLPLPEALASATWRPHHWLGLSDVVPGQLADLVVYSRDPRKDLHVLFDPTLIVIGGWRVQAQVARHLAPHRPRWSQLGLPAQVA